MGRARLLQLVGATLILIGWLLSARTRRNVQERAQVRTIDIDTEPNLNERLESGLVSARVVVVRAWRLAASLIVSAPLTLLFVYPLLSALTADLNEAMVVAGALWLLSNIAIAIGVDGPLSRQFLSSLAALVLVCLLLVAIWLVAIVAEGVGIFRVVELPPGPGLIPGDQLDIAQVPIAALVGFGFTSFLYSLFGKGCAIQFGGLMLLGSLWAVIAPLVGVDAKGSILGRPISGVGVLGLVTGMLAGLVFVEKMRGAILAFYESWLRQSTVPMRPIIGYVVIYLAIGTMFAGWYYVANQASNGAAFCHTVAAVQTEFGDASLICKPLGRYSFGDFMFLSFTTITTVGYGWNLVTPQTAFARFLVVVEPVVGLVWTVAVFALLISRVTIPGKQ